jgi:hypothetical protein
MSACAIASRLTPVAIDQLARVPLESSDLGAARVVEAVPRVPYNLFEEQPCLRQLLGELREPAHTFASHPQTSRIVFHARAITRCSLLLRQLPRRR